MSALAVLEPMEAPPPVTDHQLAARWRLGDRRAYEQIVSRHLDAVRRFLLARCGNAADADDLSQEVFLDVCQKIGGYDEAQSFTGWLYTIARRRAVDLWRRKKPLETFTPEHEGQDDYDPSLASEEKEAGELAWKKVFRLLPENQATALWMKVQGAMSIVEIAKAMSQSESNVKVLLFRARQKLAAEWHNTPEIL